MTLRKPRLMPSEWDVRTCKEVNLSVQSLRKAACIATRFVQSLFFPFYDVLLTVGQEGMRQRAANDT